MDDLHAFADTVRNDFGDLQSADYIDIQSFLWVQGSGEDPENEQRTHLLCLER